MKNLSNGVVLNYFFGEYIIYSTDQKKLKHDGQT